MPPKKTTKSNKSSASKSEPKKEAEKQEEVKEIPEVPEVTKPDTTAPATEPPSLETTPPETEQTAETTLPETTPPPSVIPVTPASATETDPADETPAPSELPAASPENEAPVSPEASETTTDDNDVFAEKPSGSGKKLFLIFIIALLFGALVVGGYFYFMSVQKPSEEISVDKDGSEETVMDQEETEATDEASMDESEEDEEESDSEDAEVKEFSDLSVQILNGSGVPGAAGAVEELLTDEGFENFDTGNASSFDYEDTEIQMKASVASDVYDAIETALSGYSVIEGDPLDDDADFDIIVIVGTVN